MKIKIFRGTDMSHLQEKIQKFLTNKIDIRHVLQSGLGESEIVITIFYLEEK